MDIICARCGKHFSSVEAAREHSGHCRETSVGEPIRWLPAPKSKITPEEWEKLMKLINQGGPPIITPSNLEPTGIESTNSEISAEPDVAVPPAGSKGKRTPKKKVVDRDKRKRTSNYKMQNWLNCRSLDLI